MDSASYEEDEALLALAIHMSELSFAEEQQGEAARHGSEKESKNKCGELRLVVIGETGSGKSETCNSILHDRDLFPAASSAASITKTCIIQKAEVLERPISIVDTPGLFDVEMDQGSLLKEITRCVMMSAPGPHAILLVIRIHRMSKQLHEMVRVFREVFGEKCTDHMIVVFTGENSLSTDRRSSTIDEYLSTVQKDVADLLTDCKYRYVVFENSVDPNSRENEKQVKELLSVVDKMLLFNGGRYYTNAMFQETECFMKKQVHEIRQKYEEKKQNEKKIMKKMFQDQLEELGNQMTQNMEESLRQNLAQEIKAIDEKYSKKDAQHEVRKNAEKDSSWKSYLDVLPTLLKLGLCGTKVYMSYKAGTLSTDIPRHLIDLIDIAQAKGDASEK